MRGFLSCFRCLFLDRASVLPSSSRARLLRVAPLSWVPSLGLKEQSCRQSWDTCKSQPAGQSWVGAHEQHPKAQQLVSGRLAGAGLSERHCGGTRRSELSTGQGCGHR